MLEPLPTAVRPSSKLGRRGFFLAMEPAIIAAFHRRSPVVESWSERVLPRDGARCQSRFPSSFARRRSLVREGARFRAALYCRSSSSSNPLYQSSILGAKPRWNGRREVFSSEMCSPIGNYTTKSTYPYDQQPQTPPPAAAAAAPVISDSEDITLFFFFFFFFLCPFLGAHTLGMS
ncbi:hypothetical protein LINPERHAP2_LOCUS33107 [Linum perenne]